MKINKQKAFGKGYQITQPKIIGIFIVLVGLFVCEYISFEYSMEASHRDYSIEYPHFFFSWRN